MQGCTRYKRQGNWHSPHGPFDWRVYRTVAGIVVAGALAIAMVQGCRGRVEFTSNKGFSSPSSGARFGLVQGSRSFSAPPFTGIYAGGFTFAGPTHLSTENPSRPGFFQRNYLSASAPDRPSFWTGPFVDSLEGFTNLGKAAAEPAGHRSGVPVDHSAAAAGTDDLLEALISAAIEGEGCKAAGGVDSSPPFYFTKMVVTGYCPLKCCCGRHADSFTASGHRISPGEGQKFAAAPRQYPFRTVFDIPGYGPAECKDRGGAIKGNKLDLYFDTHTEAMGWGVKTLIVKVTEH